MAIYSGFSHQKWWFSIAMLNYQRVGDLIVLALQSHLDKASGFDLSLQRGMSSVIMWNPKQQGLKMETTSLPLHNKKHSWQQQAEPLSSLALRRWHSCHVGRSRFWWRRFCSARSAQECAAGSSLTNGICCHLGRWICDYMGRSRVWWWLLCGPRSAQKMCSKFRPQIRHLLQSCRMDPWLLGDIQFLMATALLSKLSSGICRRFNAHLTHLLPSWLMDPSLHGAIQREAVTAMQSRSRSHLSRTKVPTYHCVASHRAQEVKT